MKIRKTKKELNKLFNLKYNAICGICHKTLYCVTGNNQHIVVRNTSNTGYRIITFTNNGSYEIITHDLYYGMLMAEKWYLNNK